ncbi:MULTISPECIES: hypothetical protein [Sphingomonas]|uniref:hypothetical protein n=1 Tax=Sphingomonas TaxID=13687 RepID=UPI00254E82F4|nr:MULTISPECIES: hypothetical protein [Sphingomonas]MDK8186737.1 hypothetical protein [Sphingomonas zeae]MDK8216401.1 hypothetical protein [Sphingomonas sp. UMB7805-LC452B]
MTWLALLRRFWPTLIALALGLWVARLNHLRADHLQTLTNERAAWSAAIADGDKARLADEARFARQQATAAQTYAAALAARQPLIIHSKDTVTRYAQTDAGRAVCRDADRVRDIDALDADLARYPAAPGGSGGAVPPDAAASTAER